VVTPEVFETKPFGTTFPIVVTSENPTATPPPLSQNPPPLSQNPPPLSQNPPPLSQNPPPLSQNTPPSDFRHPGNSNATFYVAPATSPAQQNARLTPPAGIPSRAAMLAARGSKSDDTGVKLVPASMATVMPRVPANRPAILSGRGSDRFRRVAATQEIETSPVFRANRPTDEVVYTLRTIQIKPHCIGADTALCLSPAETFTPADDFKVTFESQRPNLITVGCPGGAAFCFDPGGATRTAIGAGVPAKLAFTGQPSNATAGQTMSPVSVAVRDVFGQVVTTSTASVTIAIGNNPANGTLSGTLTKAAANGIATFDNLKIDRAGNGYTLVATSAGLTSGNTSEFSNRVDVSGLMITFQDQAVGSYADGTVTLLAGGVPVTFSGTGLQIRDITSFGFPAGASRTLSTNVGPYEPISATLTFPEGVTANFVQIRNWISGVYTTESDTIVMSAYNASGVLLGTVTSSAEFVSLAFPGIAKVVFDDVGTGYLIDEFQFMVEELGGGHGPLALHNSSRHRSTLLGGSTGIAESGGPLAIFHLRNEGSASTKPLLLPWLATRSRVGGQQIRRDFS
jgi:hypothetical protein